MRDLYLNQIVDITDRNCEFIKEFDHEIRKYGAVVYNHEYNSYQFIKHFSQIDFKKELLPDFIKIENSNPILKALTITVHYEFDPEIEEDEENLEIWEELSQINLPVFGYEDDGEIYVKDEILMNVKPSMHTIWFLSEDSYDYMMDLDLLLFDPIIKNFSIAQKLIREYGLHPFETDYDEDDLDDYEEPDVSAVTYRRREE
ncbi:MAG: hypothetical protein IJB54_00240 [Firmicutes bacterium]|nr:hypothetical protein [Bacillota bacterium]